MKNPISFITANFVARELEYSMTGGWGEGDNATQRAFQPLETFAEKFEEILTDAKSLGFEAVDIWNAHLHPEWATDEHVNLARALLEKHQLRVFSTAGGFGTTPEELEGFCKVAKALGAEMLAGGMPLYQADRSSAVRLLRQYGLKWAFENHPNEKTAEDVFAVIGTGDEDVIGVACDTGWFGTNDCDATEALRKLAPRLMHIHLKDVREPGQHRTCALGDGVVGIEACVDTLREIGYTGPIAIEHEPEHYDPMPEVAESLSRLKGWMNNANAGGGQ